MTALENVALAAEYAGKSRKEAAQATGTTFVLVAHDSEVAGACGEVIHMRDGVIEGQPQIEKTR